jgi:hypothetical protein
MKPVIDSRGCEQEYFECKLSFLCRNTFILYGVHEVPVYKLYL